MKKTLLALLSIIPLGLTSCVSTPNDNVDTPPIVDDSGDQDDSNDDNKDDGNKDDGSQDQDNDKVKILPSYTFKSKTELVDNEYQTTLTILDLDNKVIETTISKTPKANPYLSIDTNAEKAAFYASYKVANSPLDAKYRTEAGLLSGKNTEDKFMPLDNSRIDNTKVNNYRSTTMNYVLDEDSGEQVAYLLFSLDGKYTPIYKDGAYFTMNELASYTIGFGALPANQNYDKYEKMQDKSSSTWWKYGRVNRGPFSGPVEASYKHESWFVGMKQKEISYTETDFGNSTYYNPTEYDSQYQTMPYIKDNKDGTYAINSGTPGDRGVLRFVFTSEYENNQSEKNSSSTTKKNYKNQYYRRCYYTFNHYNDWHEYLNYEDGWGEVFGNMTRGNAYGKNSPHSEEMFAPIPTDSSMDEIITNFNK
ncbi:MAG: hypothetical protein H6689_01530 [Erysipelotrichaceae bacterium]|nr:hypothetical protein [Erysipelotrichaceae bacterium]